MRRNYFKYIPDDSPRYRIEESGDISSPVVVYSFLVPEFMDYPDVKQMINGWAETDLGIWARRQSIGPIKIEDMVDYSSLMRSVNISVRLADKDHTYFKLRYS